MYKGRYIYRRKNPGVEGYPSGYLPLFARIEPVGYNSYNLIDSAGRLHLAGVGYGTVLHYYQLRHIPTVE